MAPRKHTDIFSLPVGYIVYILYNFIVMTSLPVFECLYVAKFKPQSPFWIRQECEGYARIIVMTGIYLNLSAN